MLRSLCNDGWEFRPQTDRFLELAGKAAPWVAVALPHDAMVTEQRSPDGTAATAFHRDGIYEYRKRLHLPEELRTKRVLMEFEGVYRGAAVYVNGQLAGHRPYGYSQFTVDVGAYAAFGEDNEIRVEARTNADSRWYSGAGIYRAVWLVVCERVHIALDGVRITTREMEEDHAVVEIETDVVNESLETITADVVTELVDADGRVVARDVVPVPAPAGDTARLRQRLSVEKPQPWSIERPYLYACRTSLRVADERRDDAVTRFGIRVLALDAVRGFRINGATVRLRGACIHHDNGVIGAATFARAEERRVEILKAAGFNAIRSAHNPMSRAMLDACDRLGMLVMDETFDMWTVAKSNDDYARSFPEWWETDVDAMVAKDFNHPSVVLYSIGNEIIEIGTPAGAVWSRRLVDAIRSRDDTRFVTNGVNGLFAVSDELATLFADVGGDLDTEAGVNEQMTQVFDVMATAMRKDVVDARTSPAFAALDVAGYNYLESRYDIDRERHPQRVIVGTETHPQSIDQNWQYVESHAHVIGDFTWTGWDYLGEAGIGRTVWPDQGDDDVVSGFLGSYPWQSAWCGDIDITGNRRPASYYREIAFGLRDTPYIAVERPGHVGQSPSFQGPWSWSDTVSSWTWPGNEGAPVRVEVYSNADEVELLVNGRGVGREPVGPTQRLRAEFVTPYEPGEIVAIAYRDGKECGRTAVRSAAGNVLLDARADRDHVTADGQDLAYIAISLVDGDGTAYTSAERRVSVEIAGPGEIQGFGTANPRTEERFFDTECTTFDGHALAVVRPTGPGAITVTVAADGCTAVDVSVMAV
jgi:beta-galactosidase